MYKFVQVKKVQNNKFVLEFVHYINKKLLQFYPLTSAVLHMLEKPK
jgi:hypothetical protein